MLMVFQTKARTILSHFGCGSVLPCLLLHSSVEAEAEVGRAIVWKLKRRLVGKDA